MSNGYLNIEEGSLKIEITEDFWMHITDKRRDKIINIPPRVTSKLLMMGSVFVRGLENMTDYHSQMLRNRR